MKILKHFKKVSILLVMFLFMASSSFAATWYVNATNGDDLNFDGTSAVTPFRTIAAAMTAATDGDEISIATDFYAENVTVTKDLTFITTAFKGLTKATITGNLNINNNGSGAAPGISGAVSIGEGTSLGFDFTGTLDLTDGALSILSANLQFSAATVTVTVDDGTINQTPTYDNIVDVDYITGADRSSGPELPGDLNGGNLSNNTGFVLTITKDVVVDMFGNFAGDAIFNGTLLVETGTLDNTAGGDVTFKGLATFESDMDNGAGDLVFEAGFVVNVADINNTLGLVDAQANSSVTDGNITNTGTIKLNSNTLTWTSDNSGNGALTLINNAAGAEIISDASTTVGAGKIVFAGDDDFTIDGELPNLSIPNAYTGNGGGVAVAVAGIDVYGTLTLDAAAVASLNDGGNAINMYGDFLRTNDTPGNFVATGVLSFLAAVDQTFNPGASLTIANLVIDNTAGATVNMAASISINNNVTINTANAATTGNLELDTYNIRMLGVGGVFTNNGSYLSSATTGYLIFESGGANTLTGDGDFNNIDIRNTSVVTYTSDINFSGILNLRDASLNDNAGAEIFNLDDVFVTIPEINVWTDLAAFNATAAANVDISAGVLYDLTYLAGGGAYAAGGEWSTNIAPSINNLSINTTGGAVVTGPASPSTIAGVLDVDGTETVNLAADVATLVGAGVNHTVDGEVANGELVVQGDASSITGSTTLADLSSVDDLTIDLATGETFTSTGLRNINGNLTHNDGTSNIKLSDDTAAVPSDFPTFLGNLVVTNGDLSFGMTANGNVVAGTSTLTDGSLTLLSDLDVTGVTQQDDADILLGGFDYIANATYTHGPAVTTPGVVSGTGYLVLSYVGNFILNEPLSVSNLEVDGTIAQTVDDLTVTNEWLATSGAYNQAALDVTLTGNTFTQDAAVGYAATTGIFFFNGTAMTADLSADASIPNVTLDATSLEVVDNDGNATPGEFQFIISNDFVQKAGDINHNDNDVVIKNDWTRTAGNVTSIDDGFWIFDAAGTLDQGTGFSVDRVSVINGAAVLADDDAWTIVEYLQLDHNFTPGLINRGAATEALQLTFGVGAWIERMNGANSDMLDEALYEGDINLRYSTAGPITTSDEASAATINDMVVEVGVQADRDITVNGTLTLEALLDVTTIIAGLPAGQTEWDMIMADGSTVQLVDNDGGTWLDDLLNPAGTLNVHYDNNSGGAIATNDNELGTAGSPFTTGDVTVNGNDPGEDVILHRNLTTNGTLLINDDGDLDLDDLQLTIAGAYTQTSTGEIINGVGAATGAVLFGGATSSDINLNGDWTIPVGAPDYTLGINTTTADVVKTLKGGDIDFEANGADLKLMQGVFGTDANSNFILRHTDDGAQPVQGFTRSGDSHVSGNVQKYLDATNSRYPGTATIALTRVEFPTGSDPVGPATASYYRPYSLQFSSIPTAGTWITVNHTNSKPEGTNGMPLATDEGFTITNFSNFYWTMESDITIQPSVLYHVEAAAEGYNDQYADDEVQFIRFVRRFAANNDNPWVLQGASGYDNSTDGTTAVVIAKDAEGAVSSQSAIFAYSQRNQAPYFTAELADPTNIDEGDTLTQTYAIADNDVTDQDLSMFAVTLPDGATFDAATGDLEWITDNYSEGTYTVTIGATDGLDTSYSTAQVIVADVNSGVAWVSTPGAAADVAEGVLNTLQYTAETADTEKVVVYAIVNAGGAPGLAIDAATGAVSFTPAWGTVGTDYTIIISADDQAGAANSVVNQTTVLTVVKTNRAPTFTAEMPDTTIDENQALAFTYTATDADGDALTFSLGATAPAGATIDAVTGDFAWTPGFTQAGDHTFKVWVTDDGTPNMSDSSEVTVTVIDQNAPPVFTVVLPDTTIFVGDKLTFTYVAEDLDMDALTFTLDVPNPQTLSIVASDDTSATIEWTPVVTDTAMYLIGMTVSDGQATDYTQATVIVEVTTVDINGVVSYNVSGELLDAVTVTLTDADGNTMTDVTGADGAYGFAGIQSGDYTITAAKTTQWGGALASDALETQLYVVNPDSTFLATDLQKVAADVVGVGNITSSDALAILNRSVGIDDFQIDDWQFETASVTAGTQDLTQNLMGIAAGDARNDYSPALGLAKVSNIAVNSDEVLNIKKESEFELPISIAELVEIGSFTFKLKYNVEKVEFLGASTENGGTLVANVVEDVISIAWVNMGSKDINVKDGDALATLKFKATDKFGKADEVSLELLDGAEMTDRMAKNFSAGIKIPVVAIGIPDVFALRQNYPNPFNPSTTIQYDLPENGKVTLTVYNSLGQRVGTLVNTKQEAGAYEVNFNASNLASGVYLYRVTVEGSKNFVMTKKMILMK